MNELEKENFIKENVLRFRNEIFDLLQKKDSKISCFEVDLILKDCFDLGLEKQQLILEHVHTGAVECILSHLSNKGE